MRAPWCLAVAAVLAVVVAGCGTADDRDQARAVTQRFYTALRADHPGLACRQLSAATVTQLESQSGQTCAAAVAHAAGQGGRIAGVAVFITNARVTLGDGDSVYLGREPTGWKLTAIGCRATAGKPHDRPLDCAVAA